MLFFRRFHSPLGELNNNRAKLLLVKFDDERLQASHDLLFNLCNLYLLNLVNLVRELKDTAFEEHEELLVVICDEVLRQVREEGFQQLGEVARGVRREVGPVQICDCCESVENGLDGRLPLVQRSFSADSVKNHRDFINIARLLDELGAEDDIREETFELFGRHELQENLDDTN